MKKNGLRLLVACLFGGFSLPLMAQYTTTFTVVGIENEAVESRIEQTVSGLLTAFNKAQKEEDIPFMDDLDLSDDVIRNVLKQWGNCPFRCDETRVVEECSTTSDGQIQIRNIPLVLEPDDPSNTTWKKYQEGVMVFDRQGKLTDFHMALSADLYIKVMRNANVVDDFVQRQLILEYVERFRNAYNLKDMAFLEQVYSDDALIITGKVITAVKSDFSKSALNNKKIVYSRLTKRKYLDKLADVFKQNRRINVLFDDIKVVKHPAKENFYGVTLKQSYESDSYRDEGYLFLLWDFNNPEAPQIHVRTWQPDKIDVNTPLPEEEVFNINDFDI